MKKCVLLFLPLILALEACSINKKKQDEIPDWGETASKTIVFKGDKNRNGLKSGSQLGTTAFDNALKDLINTQTDNALTTFGGDKCAAQLVGGDAAEDTSLTIGTGSYAGLIYFRFNLEIVKLDFTIQNYYKPHHDYEQNVDVSGVDTSAELSVCSYAIGSETKSEVANFDLSTDDDVSIPSEREESVSFKESTKTIAFFNNAASHRTYIHSLTITYLVR